MELYRGAAEAAGRGGGPRLRDRDGVRAADRRT